MSFTEQVKIPIDSDIQMQCLSPSVLGYVYCLLDSPLCVQNKHILARPQANP